MSSEPSAMSLNYFWRLVATAICFSLFGLGGLVISLVALPISLCLDGSQHEKFAKKLVRLTFFCFVHIMRMLGVLSFSSENLEALKIRRQLIIANHPTLVDIVFLIALIPSADCIIKSDLLRNPFMRGAIRFAGFISNDDPELVIEQAAASLARGNSLIIFPEGTRSKRCESLYFLRGAANIAVRTRTDLRPVIISCNPLTLGKEDKWYEIPPTKFHYNLCVRDTLSVDAFLGEENSIASRKLTQDLETYFNTESHWNE